MSCSACWRARSRIRTALLLLVLGLVNGASQLTALDPSWAISQYPRQVWSTAQGLPHSSVNQLSQTHHGYLLVNSFSGALLFDGVHFRPLPEDIAAVAPEIVRTTHDGDTWWVGPTSVLRQGTEGPPERFDLSPLGSLRDAWALPNGDLLVAGRSGLARIVRATGQVEIDRQLEGVRIQRLLRTAGGTLWLGTWEGLLYRSENSDTPWQKHPRLVVGRVRALAEGDDDTIWVAIDDQLAVVAGERVRYLSTRDGLPAGHVQDLVYDRHGSMWIATASNGLLRVHGDELSHFDTTTGAPADTLRCLFEDRQGNLWVGTAGGGLLRLADSDFENLTPLEGLPSAFVLAVVADLDGDLWVGTNGGGLARLRAGTRPARYGRSDGLTDLNVQSLLVLRDGRLVAGTPSGLFVRSDDDRFTLFASRSVILGPSVRCLFEDPDGGIWVGADRGLTRWHETQVSLFRYPDDLPSVPVRAVRPARRGGLWLGVNGLAHWDGTVFTAIDAGPEAGAAVRDVFEDERGVLWLATPPGLIRLENGNATGISVPSAVDRTVHAVIDDGRGHFWLPTNAGLVRVRRDALDEHARDPSQTIEWAIFDESDGLRSSELNGSFGPIAANGPDGRLWLASMAGLIGVRPGVERRTSNVSAHLESVTSDRGEAIVDGDRLPTGRRRITFRYTALDLTAPERLRFRYRLEPIDDDWIDAHERRDAVYHDLGPGRYRFRVAAADRGGTYREDPRPLAFTIRPSIVERSPFRTHALLLVSLALGAALIEVWRLRRRLAHSSNDRDRR